MRLYYLLETIDAIIISQSPATAESHKSLDYIPGSSILGAIAAKSYKEFENKDKNWDVFHNGSVKYSNAYIAHIDHDVLSISYPTPLSWHIPKGDDLYTNEVLNLKMQNQADLGFKQSDNKQPYEQCRNGYISFAKNKVEVKPGSSTKTAINKDTETVEESQLFNYNYIQAGQKFIGWIEADEATIKSLENHIQSVTRLGRSRNTEFGRIKVELLKIVDNNPQHTLQLSKDDKGQAITIWLTSDCEIIDDNSLPVVAPSADQIGLQNAKLDLLHSFIINHKNILYNRKREGFDSEHLVINKGSVLVYKATAEISVEELKTIQQNGIGINQQLGFGQIIINPEWAKNLHLTNKNLFNPIKFTLKNNSHQVTTPKASDTPDTTLINWITKQAKISEAKKIRDTTVNKHVHSIISFYKNGRKYNGINNKYNAGPTKNQWGLLYSLTRDSKKAINEGNKEGKNDKYNKLITIIKPSNTDDKDWSLDWQDGKITNFYEKFISLFTGIRDLQTQRQLCEKLNQYHLEIWDDLEKLKNKTPKTNDVNATEKTS